MLRAFNPHCRVTLFTQIRRRYAADVGLDHASLTSLAALGDTTRRRMFEFIRQARRPVTREEVADSLGVSRKLAAFHLDKMVAAGLLHAHYESPAGIRKVGRRPKVHESVTEAIAVGCGSV